MFENQKKCTICNEVKYLDEFYKSKNGKSAHCKDCDRIRSKNYREKNKLVLSLKKKIYADNNKEKKRETDRKYREENKEALKQKKKEYHNKNKERICSKTNDYYYKNIEEVTVKRKEYRKTLSCILSVSNSKHKRRCQKYKTIDGSIPINTSPKTKELIKLLDMQEYKCNDCKNDIRNKHHLDHHIPLSKGGSHTISNVVFLCQSCNLKKGTSIPNKLMLVF